MAIGGAAAAMAIGARLTFPIPGSEVPQSAQTLAVILVGFALGARDGALAVLLYIAAGALGLPVFADGASGPERLLGPTAGYLAGFVAAAVGMGRLRERGALERPANILWAALAAHAVILACGALWLGLSVGVRTAFETGLLPFLFGALVKSAVAAAAIVMYRRFWMRPDARRFGAHGES